MQHDKLLEPVRRLIRT